MNPRSFAALFLVIGAGGAPAQGAPSTDVYRLRLDPGAKVFNITNRGGYDNQPAYLQTDGSTRLAWTSQRDGQTDIYWLKDAGESPFAATAESEYSAAMTPDGKAVAVIRVERDSAQRLWQFPLDGGAPSVILPGIKPVGYFAFLDSTTLALFVLGNPSIPRDPSTLQIADTRAGTGVIVARNIGRSIQRVPGARRASFTQRIGGRTTLLTVDATPRRDGSFAIDTVVALPDSADYVVWRDSRTLITGAGSRLLQLRLPSTRWEVLVDLSGQGIHGISRLALSPSGDEIAFVADEPKP